MDLKELGNVDPKNFWFYVYKGNFIFKKMSKYLNDPKIIFDVGAGSGFFASIFVSRSNPTKAYCIDPYYSDEQIGERDNLIFVKDLPPVQPDTLLFIDVLEHVADDLALLSYYVEKAQKGAVFAISVPAFQSLWSNHDVFLEHYRRYRKSEVQKLVKSAGLIELESTYIFGSIFPLVWVIRKLKRKNNVSSDLKPSSKWVNFLVLNFLNIEKFVPVNKFFGTSVFVIAKKPYSPE
jgi:hypothetical protein